MYIYIHTWLHTHASIYLAIYIYISCFQSILRNYKAPSQVNPFQNLAGLYSEAKQTFYREQSAAAGLVKKSQDVMYIIYIHMVSTWIIYG